MTSKRIIVIGMPGSGKTTFSLKLARLLNIPLHHLDRLLFIPGGVKREREEYTKMHEELIHENSWIIEGCGLRSLEPRYSRATAVIYLKVPRLVCIWRSLKRFIFEKNDHPDTPDDCSKVFTCELIKYIWTFEKKKGPGIQMLRKKYPKIPYYELKNLRQIESFLADRKSK